MDNRGYFFIDGSTLFSQISWLWKKEKGFKDKPLQINTFVNYLMNRWNNYCGATVRVSFYFRKQDPRLRSYLSIPKSNSPGQKNHWEIIECAERNPIIPIKILDEIRKAVPEKYAKYLDFLIPKEKGLDMRLACDALRLVANDKTTNVVFYINDSDYIPLIEACKAIGVNVYLTSLTQKNPVQEKLCNISDMYLTLDEYLRKIFDLPSEQK